jgi:hypothetical protein
MSHRNSKLRFESENCGLLHAFVGYSLISFLEVIEILIAIFYHKKMKQDL